MKIKIAERWIGSDERPFIVAEMSGNHNQSLERALAIVEAAAKVGADALKLQTATPDGLTLNIDRPEFVISDENSPWYGSNLYALYQQAVTPWEWHKPIFERCRELGLIGFSSPFEERAVDYLESLDVPCYKIASFELTDHELILRAARTGKPIIMSTGMASVGEIEEAVNIVRSADNRQIILLKCTSTYPATPEDSNIASLPHLRELFGTLVGLSDHTMGIGIPCAAVALGACMVEKHFTLARADGGVDSSFSLEPEELAALVTETERAWLARGKIQYGPACAREKQSVNFRRSLYIVEDIGADEVLTPGNLRSIRPGHGLEPKYLHKLLGRRVNRNVKKGTPMSWEFIG